MPPSAAHAPSASTSNGEGASFNVRASVPRSGRVERELAANAAGACKPFYVAQSKQSLTRSQVLRAELAAALESPHAVWRQVEDLAGVGG